MMLITKEYLESLNPCEDRFDNYLQHHDNWSGTLEAFLNLPELTHDDKKWVFMRSISKDKIRLVAADFAERVLHIYENKYPNDDRPRKAIEAARSGNSAYDATDAADAAYAATDAANAANAAAYSATDAARTARATRVAYAAYAATDAAAAAADAAAADARSNEEKTQLEIMKKYAREALKGE